MLEAEAQSSERTGAGLGSHERQRELDDLRIGVIEGRKESILALDLKVGGPVTCTARYGELSDGFDGSARDGGVGVGDERAGRSESARRIGVPQSTKSGRRKNGIARVGHDADERLRTAEAPESASRSELNLVLLVGEGEDDGIGRGVSPRVGESVDRGTPYVRLMVRERALQESHVALVEGLDRGDGPEKDASESEGVLPEAGIP
jgi:hypothetical protein